MDRPPRSSDRCRPTDSICDRTPAPRALAGSMTPGPVVAIEYDVPITRDLRHRLPMRPSGMRRAPSMRAIRHSYGSRTSMRSIASPRRQPLGQFSRRDLADTARAGSRRGSASRRTRRSRSALSALECRTRGHSGSRRRRMVRKFIRRASTSSSRPASVSPIPRINLIASVAWMVPMRPGSTPSTPASAQLGTSPGGGGSRKRQR